MGRSRLMFLKTAGQVFAIGARGLGMATLSFLFVKRASSQAISGRKPTAFTATITETNFYPTGKVEYTRQTVYASRSDGSTSRVTQTPNPDGTESRQRVIMD